MRPGGGPLLLSATGRVFAAFLPRRIVALVLAAEACGGRPTARDVSPPTSGRCSTRSHAPPPRAHARQSIPNSRVRTGLRRRPARARDHRDGAGRRRRFGLGERHRRRCARTRMPSSAKLGGPDGLSHVEAGVTGADGESASPTPGASMSSRRFPAFFDQVPAPRGARSARRVPRRRRGACSSTATPTRCRLAGHSCPTAASAYALAHARDDAALPGAVADAAAWSGGLPAPLDEGVTGVVATVVGLHRRAPGTAASRHRCALRAPQPATLRRDQPLALRFSRSDTGASVDAAAELAKVQPTPRWPSAWAAACAATPTLPSCSTSGTAVAGPRVARARRALGRPRGCSRLLGLNRRCILQPS